MNFDYKALAAKVVVFAKANAVGLIVGVIVGIAL